MSRRAEQLHFIPVNEPLLNGNERKYLNECIDTNWISCDGPFVQRFEAEFSAINGRRHGIAVSSGTAALDVAVAALGIGPGDEVIMPSFTIISNAQAIVGRGAIPVLVDADPHDWNMAVDQIEAKITDKTKAIMVVHIYGLTVDMAHIQDLATRYGLEIIEDAAQAIGQRYDGRPCGSFGALSVFSFFPNKFITTGEGGMIVTDDEHLAERCRSLRNLCFQAEKRFVHEELGWNYRITNMQAALGCAQLEKLPDHLRRKREIAIHYNNLLQGLPIQLPLPASSHSENQYWIYGVVLDDKAVMEATEVMAELAARNIGSRPFFWPMHEQPVLRKRGLFSGEVLPVSERLARRGFYLPNGLTLTDEQITRVSEALKEILQ